MEERVAQLERELAAARAEAAEGRFFRKLVEASNDIIGVTGADGLVRFLSAASERITGRPNRELLGQIVLNEIHPEDLARVRAAMKEALASPPDRCLEIAVRRRHADGRWVQMQTSARNLSADPDVLGIVTVGRDVTAAVALEEQLRDAERMFRALFERTSIAVTIRDVATQQFIDCNQAALDLYCIGSREELRGTTPDQLATPTQPDGRSSLDVLRAYVQRAMRDGVAQMEWTARRQTGETFPAKVRTTVITLEDGRRVMQTMIEDVTELRRSQDLLSDRSRRDELVSRVSRRFVEDAGDDSLPYALEELAKFLGAARLRARRFSEDGASLDTLEEWRAPGVAPHALAHQDASSPIVRWLVAEIARKGYVAVDDADVYPPGIPAPEPRGAPASARGRRAQLIVPMSNRGAVIGWIVADRVGEPPPWSDDDVATARLVAEIIAVGRARAEAETQLRWRAVREELLSNVSRRFLNDAPESAIDTTLERVGEVFEAENARLFTLDERAHRLRCTHRWGARASDTPIDPLEAYPVPEGALVGVDAPGTVDVGSSAKAERWLEELQRASDGRVLQALVGYGGRVFGLLMLRGRHGRAWTDGDASTLRRIGELIAIGRLRSAAEIALATAKEDAVAASLTKSAFLANMSHELRTPLNGVIGMVDLLRTTALDDRQRHYTEVAGASASLLLSVISDILDFSKIEAGKLEIESLELNLNEIVEEVASILALSAEEKRLELSCHSSISLAAPLVGDPARLRQVLVNLVSNAVKFTRKGEVSVRASLVAESDRDARVRVEVHDTGVGIPPASRDKLFRPFTQVDASTTREHGGTGLGLAICHELVERMGGTIGFTSEPGVGSTFWFEITLAKASGRVVLDAERDPDLVGLRVLGVDDNATNRELLREHLRAAGMRCETAADGFEALRMLAEAAPTRPYAIALIDHHMPGMDGRELAWRVTADERLRATKLVMIGSVASPLRIDEQREVGIVGFCTKPVWRKQLLRVLRAAIRDGAPRESSSEGAMQSAPGIAAHILIVEDSPINAEVAGEIVRAAGHTFDLAVDGAAAVEAARSRGYDVVLMDCQLPEMDGYEATRRIRALEQAGELPRRERPLPIVALTASATKGDLERCFAAGMNDHVSKPVDAKRLLAVVARHLDERATPLSSRLAQPEVAVADLSRALARLQGDRALLRRIARQLVGVAAEARAKLREALERRDTAAVAFAAHRLRGQAASFDATALMKATEALEGAARRESWTAVAAELSTVETELDRLLELLAKEA